MGESGNKLCGATKDNRVKEWIKSDKFMLIDEEKLIPGNSKDSYGKLTKRESIDRIS